MVLAFATVAMAAGGSSGTAPAFPPSLDSYGDGHMDSIPGILANRIRQEPFNLIATLIFIGAIVHTFLTGRFMVIAHRWHHDHAERIKKGMAPRESVHHGAELFHFLGEVEAVFGIWAAALVGALVLYFDWPTAKSYVIHGVNFTEAMFVVVIMTLAATRPILRLSERLMWKVAGLLGGSLTAWWWAILTIGPLLGAFITEPAAMTIAAMLLGEKIYALSPSKKFKYATLGLLFVNVSVGGTLTSYAAPPVLMVSGPWNWNTVFMFSHFGWKAIIGVLLANLIYFLLFRSELKALQAPFAMERLKDEIQQRYLKRQDVEAQFDACASEFENRYKIVEQFSSQLDDARQALNQRLEREALVDLKQKGIDPETARTAFRERNQEIQLRRMRRDLPGLLPPEERPPFIDPDWDHRDDPIPVWVTVVHLAFMGWTILNAHDPAFFIPGILFFLGFAQVSAPYQNRINLKPALLVGFFLGGLVIHGGLQGWWIEPVLSNLSKVPLMLGATILTAFNDNAAITFLSTLVPDFSDAMKYSVVAGAVAGGGLTVIANAPNPAGLSILKPYFDDEVSPGGIFLAAAIPTVVMWLLFLFL
ncbi:putative Na+/H+ antiporter [Desulfosarcina cetonica]|uniref:putative Na+/H+ antiporter n=1 Tax=Desulfosarcina cetonica TaxID=90730 RepID=UPI001FEE6BF1|nr:putative Na+/H+ antiporter [Desulfosarcina cetonica]